MMSIFAISIGLAIGTVIYQFLTGGVGGIDFYRASFVALFSMPILYMYFRFGGKLFSKQR